jgi:hypothetical protein
MADPRRRPFRHLGRCRERNRGTQAGRTSQRHLHLLTASLALTAAVLIFVQQALERHPALCSGRRDHARLRRDRLGIRLVGSGPGHYLEAARTTARGVLLEVAAYILFSYFVFYGPILFSAAVIASIAAAAWLHRKLGS